jgi:hypothetical protein
MTVRIADCSRARSIATGARTPSHLEDLVSIRDTPPIPSWIREFRDTRDPPQFLNVFDEEEFPREWQLHDANHPVLLANESMYGRWSDSRVLILARDAGTKWNFIPSDRGGRGFPWIHDETRPTNRNLRPFADCMQCPKLYGSAMSCLVLNADEERVSLMRMLNNKVEDFVVQVLRWIIDHTPRLELVICLGEDSWTLTMAAFGTGLPRFNAVRGCGPLACASVPQFHFAAVHRSVALAGIFLFPIGPVATCP